MAEKKKKQPDGFAKDKNAFAGGSPPKGDIAKKAKQMQTLLPDMMSSNLQSRMV